MFSLTQLRTIQGLVADLSALALQDQAGIARTLGEAAGRSDEKLAALRFVEVRLNSGFETRGLIFRYHSDPAHSAKLVLRVEDSPSQFLHADWPAKETRPTLIGLHYALGGRKRPSVAHYLLTGAMTAYGDSGFEYLRLKRKTRKTEALATLLHNLNLRVEDLPYPAGRKLETLDVFRKMDLRYVGEIVNRDPAELARELGSMRWTMIRSILGNMNLRPGTAIPQWKAPR